MAQVTVSGKVVSSGNGRDGWNRAWRLANLWTATVLPRQAVDIRESVKRLRRR